METQSNTRKDDLMVISNQITKSLLAMGFKVVGIAPNNTDPKRTVHFFKKENGIEQILQALIKQSKAE